MCILHWQIQVKGLIVRNRNASFGFYQSIQTFKTLAATQHCYPRVFLQHLPGSTDNLPFFTE